MPDPFRSLAVAVLALLLVPAVNAQRASLPPAPGVLQDVSPPDLPIVARGGQADVSAQWIGDPQWLVGVNTGGMTFDGGVIRGRFFISGSSIFFPTGDFPAEVVFSDELETLAQTFRLSGDNSGEALGVGTFPGAAYDVSDPDNPRRVNMAFAESANPDFVWNPDGSGNGGGEFFFVMGSDYDGTGETYADVDFLDSPPEDVMYVVWGRVPEGRELLEADATLDIRLADIARLRATVPANGEVNLDWDYISAGDADELRLYTGLEPGADELLATLDPQDDEYTHVVSDPELRYYRLEGVDADGEVVDISREISAFTFISQSASLAGRADPRADYGDVWGYVDPATGREYALLTARYDGLSVIDLDTETPTEVGFVPGLAGFFGGVADAKDIKTYGRYAYLAHEYADVLVVDLADPTDPQAVGQLDVQPGTEDGGSHNLLVEGDYLYVVGGRSPGGLRIYDLADDPTAPALVGTYEPTYFHDVDVVGDVLYAGAIYNEGIYVIDISDRSAPREIGVITYPVSGSMGAHNVCSTADGNTIFVGDEIGSEPWTRAFDVSEVDADDAELPDVELLSEIVVDERATVHNCYVKGDLIYIAHYTEGLQVFDVSDPSDPERVAFYDTYPEPGYGFEGAWTAYPYLPSGRVIVSNLGTGLYVIDLDNSVAEEPDAGAPLPLSLAAPFPNPTAGAATLRFALEQAGHARLTLYDALGRTVAVLLDEARPAGEHAAAVEAATLATGTYFARLEVGGRSVTQPLVVLR